MIESVETLRRAYGEAKGRSLKKQIDHIDRHCARFVALSPFLVIASRDGQGALDASPRGGEPGFVRVPDARTSLIPDSPGNNRLDTLTNIIATDSVGLLFMIPGVDETLRVNGRARLVDDAALRATFADEKRTPKLVIEITVTDAYLHCAKAFMRSKLCSADSRIERTALPTMGEMLGDKTGMSGVPETQVEMQARYAQDLKLRRLAKTPTPPICVCCYATRLRCRLNAGKVLRKTATNTNNLEQSKYNRTSRS